ncbi:hypothetical protein JL720_14187 [Aureococcus anophagefferens]|nr:hypothetical protein JL720_14187 [Aureococcus anophagefferens]
MVRGIERTGDGAWALRGTDGAELGRFDWLAVSGSGVAHDRWTATFGGEPPLKAAAASSATRRSTRPSPPDVYGATSTAARIGGALSDASREEALVAALLSSAEARLAAFDAALAGPFYGPHLHRWGSAFPAGVLVPPDAAVVPSARVVFLGDYVDTGRAGTLEGAAPASPRRRAVDAAAAARAVSRETNIEN